MRVFAQLVRLHLPISPHLYNSVLPAILATDRQRYEPITQDCTGVTCRVPRSTPEQASDMPAALDSRKRVGQLERSEMSSSRSSRLRCSLPTPLSLDCCLANSLDGADKHVEAVELFGATLITKEAPRHSARPSSSRDWGGSPAGPSKQHIADSLSVQLMAHSVMCGTWGDGVLQVVHDECLRIDLSQHRTPASKAVASQYWLCEFAPAQSNQPKPELKPEPEPEPKPKVLALRRRRPVERPRHIPHSQPRPRP